MDFEVCEVDEIHDGLIKKVVAEMDDEETLYEVAELFKVFGDSTRTRIISALKVSALCVCDIASVLKMTKSAVSHQLRILRQTKIVKAKKSGREVFYSLDDEHIEKIYKMAIEHLKE